MLAVKLGVTLSSAATLLLLLSAVLGCCASWKMVVPSTTSKSGLLIDAEELNSIEDVSNAGVDNNMDEARASGAKSPFMLA